MPMLPTCITGWSDPSNTTLFTTHFAVGGKGIADRPLVRQGRRPFCDITASRKP